MIFSSAAIMALVGGSAIVGVGFSYVLQRRGALAERANLSSGEGVRNDDEEMKIRNVLHAAASSSQNKSRREFVTARLAASASQKGQYGATDFRGD